MDPDPLWNQSGSTTPPVLAIAVNHLWYPEEVLGSTIDTVPTYKPTLQYVNCTEQETLAKFTTKRQDEAVMDTLSSKLFSSRWKEGIH